jgi:coenzyme F420-reducing hydrogenase delta subunit
MTMMNDQLCNISRKILVFACGYCPMMGAREAGLARLPLPANFRVISVACISRVEPDTVIRAFSLGMDGVAVLGCHLDGCRYNHANHRSAKQMKLLKTLLNTVGMDERRLLTGYGTAHEAHQFADLMVDFICLLQGLPPVQEAGCRQGGCQ